MQRRWKYGRGGSLVWVAGAGTVLLASAEAQADTLTAVPSHYGDRAGMEYGVSMSLDENVLVVGAPNRTGNNFTNAGAAFVYARNGSAWDAVTMLAADAARFDRFGEAVAVDGDVIVVGARGHDAAGADAGTAYVYRFTSGSWSFESQLTPAGLAAGDSFGKAVAVSGDLIVVGAPGDDDVGSNSGRAYVFRHDPLDPVTPWKADGTFPLPADLTSGDEFGRAVAVDTGVVLIGAPSREGGGAVYVAQGGPGWTISAAYAPAGLQGGDEFGAAVALDGSRAIVGAPLDSEGGLSQNGAAYVLTGIGSAPSLDAKLMLASPASTDSFGFAVDILGTRVIVGAFKDDAGPVVDGGVAQTYILTGSGWVEEDTLALDSVAASDYFGYSVGLASTHAAVGAYRDDPPGLTGLRGSFTSFDLGLAPPPTDQPPTANAGADVSLTEDRTAFLDGSGSFDDNTATSSLQYQWTMVSRPVGSVADLDGANTQMPLLVADLAGPYVVSLVVTDSGGNVSSPDLVMITSENGAPTAEAGSPRLVPVGGAVLLDGGESTDPDEDLLDYHWTLLSAPLGSGAVVSNAEQAIASFTPDLAGEYVFELEVSDLIGPGNPDTVVITATNAATYAEAQLSDAALVHQSLTPAQVTTKGNSNALGNFLAQAAAAIQDGDTSTALHKISQALDRTDGCVERDGPDGNGPGRDWVTDCTAQEALYHSLSEALAALGY